jgi:hypothetical protein
MPLWNCLGNALLAPGLKSSSGPAIVAERTRMDPIRYRVFANIEHEGCASIKLPLRLLHCRKRERDFAGL